MSRRFGVVLLGLATLSCVRGGLGAAEPKNAHAESCHYEATLDKAQPAVLDVSVSCVGRGVVAFIASEAPALAHMSPVVDDAGRELLRDGTRFSFESPRVDAKIRYRVDLDGIARDNKSFDVALRTGGTLIAPASTWLLRPVPDATATPVTVRVTTPPGVGFTTGLTRAGGVYRLSAHEIRVATYALFGAFESREIELPAAGDTEPGGSNATIEVAIAEGPLQTPSASVVEWVEKSAQAVAQFWRGFPVRRTLVTIVPVRGRSGVVFGKVLPESSPGIVILLGEHTPAEELFDDWVLVHELFHLGFPSFNGEGKWLDEGLATYYEPIIRARAGHKTEEDVWAEFVRAMPQGLPALTRGGLEQSSEYRQIYWGGAIVSLLADVEIRKRSGGTRGLEDGLRAVLGAGGNAAEVWDLARAVSVVDEATGSDTLDTLTRAHAHRGSQLDLDRLWRDLGITRTTRGVRLSSSAPLSAVRRAIVTGEPEPSDRAR